MKPQVEAIKPSRRTFMTNEQPNFAQSAIASSRLRIQQARRQRFISDLNQRRGIVCLKELVLTSAMEETEENPESSV